MLRRSIFLGVLISSFISLEIAFLIPSPFIQLTLFLLLSGFLASFFAGNAFFLNAFSSMYCMLVALLGALGYPLTVLFVHIVTMLVSRDFLEILTYGGVWGARHLARYYLPFYSVIILVFYAWLMLRERLSPLLPFQAVILCAVGVMLLYIFATRSARRIEAQGPGVCSHSAVLDAKAS
ncbi:MAG: hypothetical protein LM590_03030 [Thermofilum sp.]|nr:hypothetical protein [Thermofilum sp.]